MADSNSQRFTTDAHQPVDKSRVASFSDNVISIALTLLVLDVRIPGPIDHLTWHDVHVQLLPRLMSGVGWVYSPTFSRIFHLHQSGGRVYPR